MFYINMSNLVSKCRLDILNQYIKFFIKILLYFYKVVCYYKKRRHKNIELLAQLVEHLTFNQRVAGSNPA